MVDIDSPQAWSDIGSLALAAESVVGSIQKDRYTLLYSAAIVTCPSVYFSTPQFKMTMGTCIIPCCVGGFLDPQKNAEPL
jgi:hypothetical protein